MQLPRSPAHNACLRTSMTYPTVITVIVIRTTTIVATLLVAIVVLIIVLLGITFFFRPLHCLSLTLAAVSHGQLLQ